MAKQKYKDQIAITRNPHLEARKTKSEIKQYPIPLLWQGFVPGIVAPSGTTVSQQYQIETNRGTLHYLDVQPFFNDSEIALDNKLTVSAGGQTILKDATLAYYSFKAQLGKDHTHRIRINLNDAQTLEAELVNNLTTSLQAVQIQAWYTNEQHQKYIHEEFSLKWGQGLKRRTYSLEVVSGLALQTLTLNDIIPRQNGNVIAIGICCSGGLSFEFDARNNFINVAIDDVTIVKDVWMPSAGFTSGRDNYLLPIKIMGGSTFQMSALVNSSVSIETTEFSLTFYFDN